MIKIGNDVKLFFEISVIICSILAVAFVGYGVCCAMTDPNPFYEESIPEDIVTLFGAIQYADEYLERYQETNSAEIILIDMDVSKENGRGHIDLTYEYDGKRNERCKISIDTENHLINGGSGDTRIYKTILNTHNWTIDNDEIVKIAEDVLQEKIGEFDYLYIHIGSIVCTSSYPTSSQLFVSFRDEYEEPIDSSKIYVDAISGEIEVLNPQ